MIQLLKPNKLNPGDKVAVATLSWGGPGTFPYRYEVGKERLESIFGLKVVPTQHALKNPGWLYENPKARAEDLMEAFRDPSIKAIFSSIGGDDTLRLLPYIDLDVLTQNPKIFLGFSDTTVNHFMCLKAGVSSFYGPAVMTAFAENVQMHEYSLQGINRVLFSNAVIGDIPQNTDGWTKEHLDWENPSYQSIQRKLYDLIKQTAEKRNSLFFPIKLTLAHEEHKRRITSPERAVRFKTTNHNHMHKKVLLSIDHPHLLDIDVTDLSSAEVASEILNFVERVKNDNV